MKASIVISGVALALGNVAAYAQSAVTVYGIVDLAVTSRQLAGENKVTGVTSGGMSTSRWGINGSEDLGGGMTALFDLSSFMRADTGEAGRSPADSSYWSRFSWVGLGSPMGTLRLGRITTGGFVNAVRFNPFGDSSLLSPFLLHTYLPSASQSLLTSDGYGDSAWSNSVTYATPSLAGFTGSIQAAAREATTAGRRLGINVIYSVPNVPFSAGFSYENTDGAIAALPRRNPASGTPAGSFAVNDITNATLGASYDFGVAKLFGQYRHATLENLTTTVRLKTAQLGTSVPFGAGRFLASVARTEKTETALVDQSRTSVALGYDYDLSKRTDLYVAALSDKATGLSRGKTFAAGIRHRF